MAQKLVYASGDAQKNELRDGYIAAAYCNVMDVDICKLSDHSAEPEVVDYGRSDEVASGGEIGDCLDGLMFVTLDNDVDSA